LQKLGFLRLLGASRLALIAGLWLPAAKPLVFWSSWQLDKRDPALHCMRCGVSALAIELPGAPGFSEPRRGSGCAP
jgi:hypothetical protein